MGTPRPGFVGAYLGGFAKTTPNASRRYRFAQPPTTERAHGRWRGWQLTITVPPLHRHCWTSECDQGRVEHPAPCQDARDTPPLAAAESLARHRYGQVRRWRIAPRQCRSPDRNASAKSGHRGPRWRAVFRARRLPRFAHHMPRLSYFRGVCELALPREGPELQIGPRVRQGRWPPPLERPHPHRPEPQAEGPRLWTHARQAHSRRCDPSRHSHPAHAT